MLQFCQENQFFITNTMSRHIPQHRHTWTSPNQLYKNCIDYILIGRRWKSFMSNTKVMLSADFDTTHELLISNIKSKFRINKTRTATRRKIAVDKLENAEIKDRYRANIEREFREAMQRQDLNIDEMWATFKRG